MPLDFNFEEILHTEFGVGREVNGVESFSLLPVDAEVQTALREMAESTWNTICGFEGEGRVYEPSEKYAPQEYVFLPIESVLAENLRLLHQANDIEFVAGALTPPSALFCYFARFADRRGRRLTAVRRATQFKGIVKSRLIQFMTDALKIVADTTFRLDHDFDLLVDSAYVHILRPSGFEAIGGLQDAICSAVPANIDTISAQMEFVDFTRIGAYAAAHPRAARHLASIRSQGETENISKPLLLNACATHGIGLEEVNEKISVLSGFEMAFLHVLDRRMYELELVEGAPERYRAASRQRVSD